MRGSAPSCPTDRLSAFLDGDLPASDAQVVRAHVEGCVTCTRALDDLSALVTAARALDRPEPPVSLWPAIAGRLQRDDDAEGIAGADGGRRAEAGGGPLARRLRAWWPAWSWRPFGAGALAGAAVAGAVALVVVAGAGRGWMQRRAHTGGGAVAASAGGSTAAVAVADPLLEEAEVELSRAAAAYERSIEKLRGLLERESAHWPPADRARHAERMAALDDAIARSREVARRTPGDSAGNEQLFAAYQQKIAFLAAAVHRGGARGRGQLGDVP